MIFLVKPVCSHIWHAYDVLLILVDTDHYYLISSQLFEKNIQTMGCTKTDKDKLGKDWIDKLQLSYECHDFHGQVLKCHSI